MRYGFVIDQNRCIGCHACTVACKEEHNVPIGVYRTWVKYIEKGEFPDTKRYFSVLRCNHCDDAPCIEICPTRALFRRRDGIVDFDSERCIGCKSCMQACPYDALYIDPNTQTAAKCNFCAHRVEVGLEPACVIVCPEQAILAGDLDDPASKVARTIATEKLQVRKPEQGTKPKLYYLGVDGTALTPQALKISKENLWSDRQAGAAAPSVVERDSEATETLGRTVYDVSHQSRPWGWKVSTYLWTKSLATGPLLLVALLFGLDRPSHHLLMDVTAPLLALLFVTVTSALLIADLKRPERFYYILIMPNPTSWLVLGAWILLGFGLFSTAWLVGVLLDWHNFLHLLSWPLMFLAAAAAGYSAFLFGQAEGRDFWQNSVGVLWHLIAASVVAGAASLIFVSGLTGLGPQAYELLRVSLAGGLLLSMVIHGAELFVRHPTVDGVRAAKLLTSGPYRIHFWGGVIILGHLAPLLVGLFFPEALLVASALALAGLWLHEELWVRTGQAVPLS